MATSLAPTQQYYTEENFSDFEHTGPGTLAGRYMRAYWQPVYVAEDVEVGWAKPIRIMSEDFTLYRGESGTPYLVAFRCAHRGTQLSTGWVDGECIRCRYHGWKYDGNGQCVEAPLEAFTPHLAIKSYPCQEYLGLIFAYLGEGDPPSLPRYPKFEEEGLTVCEAAPRACNFFSELENDPGHGPFTHHRASLPDNVFDIPLALRVEESPFGISWFYTYKDGELRRERGMPNLRHEMMGPWPNGRMHYVMRWKVPIDDYQHIGFKVDFLPVTPEEAERHRAQRAAWLERGGKITAPQLVEAIMRGDLRLRDVERGPLEVERTHLQDDVTQIGQGALRDRSTEHLGRSDGHVILLRRLWQREMRAFAEDRPLTQWYLPDELDLPAGTRQAQEGGTMYYERSAGGRR